MLLALVAGLALGAPASAALLGSPLLFPLLSFDNTGSTAYDAASNLFRVDADPIALRLDPASAPFFITPLDGTEFFEISILVDETGALVGGADPALEVFGRVDLGGGNVFEGMLLTGSATGFGHQNNAATDLFDFSFAVTGGLLADRFGAVIAVAMQSERSSFAGTFRESFGGGAKGTLGVIPEPTTMMLLGLGVGGLSLAGRRRAA